MQPRIIIVFIALVCLLMPCRKTRAQNDCRFFDSFLDNRNNWSIGREPSFTAEIDSGRFFVHNHNNRDVKRFLLNNIAGTSTGNFQITMQFHKPGDIDNKPFGIVWNFVDENNYNACVITDKGYIRAERMKEGQQINEKWAFTEYFHHDTSGNTLTVTGTESGTVMMINNKIVGITKRAPLSEGMAGFYLSDQQRIYVTKFSVCDTGCCYDCHDSIAPAFRKIIHAMKHNFAALKTGNGFDAYGITIYSLAYLFPLANEGSLTIDGHVREVTYAFSNAESYSDALSLYNCLVQELEKVRDDQWLLQTVKNDPDGLLQSYTVYDPAGKYKSVSEAPQISVMLYRNKNFEVILSFVSTE